MKCPYNLTPPSFSTDHIFLFSWAILCPITEPMAALVTLTYVRKIQDLARVPWHPPLPSRSRCALQSSVKLVTLVGSILHIVIFTDILGRLGVDFMEQFRPEFSAGIFSRNIFIHNFWPNFLIFSILKGFLVRHQIFQFYISAENYS
jgi:hypothetical protein